MVQQRVQATWPAADELVELSFDEIQERYDGEWIWMRVTRYDERNCWPTHGYVVARADRQDDLLDLVDRLPDSVLLRGSGLPTYSFLAGSEVRSGPEYEAAVLEFAAAFEAAKRDRGVGAS